MSLPVSLCPLEQPTQSKGGIKLHDAGPSGMRREEKRREEKRREEKKGGEVRGKNNIIQRRRERYKGENRIVTLRRSGRYAGRRRRRDHKVKEDILTQANRWSM